MLRARIFERRREYSSESGKKTNALQREKCIMKDMSHSRSDKNPTQYSNSKQCTTWRDRDNGQTKMKIIVIAKRKTQVDTHTLSVSTQNVLHTANDQWDIHILPTCRGFLLSNTLKCLGIKTYRLPTYQHDNKPQMHQAERNPSHEKSTLSIRELRFYV